MVTRDLTYRPLGAACVVVGAAAIYVASDYPYGTVTAMGPGFIPTGVAVILIALGALILLARGGDVPAGAGEADGANPDRPVFSIGFLRAFAAIGGAIILFGLAIKPLGLALTTFLAVIAGGLGHPGVHWRALILLAAGLAVASCVIFVLLLSQSIPLFPRGL